jgi:hypothetical protein
MVKTNEFLTCTHCNRYFFTKFGFKNHKNTEHHKEENESMQVTNSTFGSETLSQDNVNFLTTADQLNGHKKNLQILKTLLEMQCQLLSLHLWREIPKLTKNLFFKLF